MENHGSKIGKTEKSNRKIGDKIGKFEKMVAKLENFKL